MSEAKTGKHSDVVWQVMMMVVMMVVMIVVMMVVVVLKWCWSLVIGCEDGVKGRLWVKTCRHQLFTMTTIKIL